MKRKNTLPNSCGSMEEVEALWRGIEIGERRLARAMRRWLVTRGLKGYTLINGDKVLEWLTARMKRGKR